MGEMISNSKLFIDFGDASIGGAIHLVRVQNLKDSDERSVEVKKAMGVKGGAGFIRKQGGGTITISEYRQDVPQVRWRLLQKREIVFMLSLQDGDIPGEGVRQKWFSCTVSKVDRSDNDDGEHMDEIEIKYLSSEESA